MGGARLTIDKTAAAGGRQAPRDSLVIVSLFACVLLWFPSSPSDGVMRSRWFFFPLTLWPEWQGQLQPGAERGGGGGVLGKGGRMGVNQENIILTPYLCEDHWQDLNAEACVCLCVLVVLSLQMILSTKTPTISTAFVGKWTPPPHPIKKKKAKKQKSWGGAAPAAAASPVIQAAPLMAEKNLNLKWIIWICTCLQRCLWAGWLACEKRDPGCVCHRFAV